MDELINVTYEDLARDLQGLDADAVLAFDIYLLPDPNNHQEMPISSITVSRADLAIDSQRIKWFSACSNGKLPRSEDITLSSGIRGKRIWSLNYPSGYVAVFEK